MGAAGAGPATRSGERRPGGRRGCAAAAGTTCCGRHPARPSLRFVPTGSRSPAAASTPGSAPKLTPARRGGAAAPRPPPTPGRGRPTSCPRRGCRPGAPPGRSDRPGLSTQRGCDNTRSVGVPTDHPLRHGAQNARVSGPHGGQGHTQRGLPWIGSAGGSRRPRSQQSLP